MSKKKKAFKIKLLWIELLCTISMVLSVCGIVMFCSTPELREVPGMLIGGLILGLSIILIVFAMIIFIATIWALEGNPKNLKYIYEIIYIDNSKEDKYMMDFVKKIAILTVILAILMTLSFFF